MPETPDIKFRMRIKRKGNGVEDVSFFFFTLDMILQGFLKPFERFEEWEILSIDRFTGLFDIAEQEIYEKDIIKPQDDNGLKYAHVIMHQHGCFGYMNSMDDFQALGRHSHYFNLQQGSHKSDKIIIIGNAHENPKLAQEIENNG